VRPVLLALLVAACSNKTVPAAKADDRGSATPIDIAAPERPSPGPEDIPHVTPPAGNPRAAHPIAITLRSSPPGATAAVDGTVVGTTPAYWAGDADGHEHEFTFDLRGFALARYRFVPITSGVVHARLEPIAEETDAGVAAEQVVPKTGAVLVAPPPAPVAPDAYVAPAPPTVPPDAAAAAVPPAPDAAAPPPLGPQP
jgi:hypothetical protein